LQEYGPCLYFEKIKGADYPLVCNLLTTDNRFLWALGIDSWHVFNDEWMRRAEKLIPPKMVKDAPCQEEWNPSESFYTNGRTSQAEAYRTLKKLVPGIIDLRCAVAYETIVKIKKLFKGHPQQVIDAVWGATYSRYKHVIVVDEDIDIWVLLCCFSLSCSQREFRWHFASSY
jgi:3-polyprenyl-4-hydroxybenzoate decarboxylase